MRLRQGLKEKGIDHGAARLRENVTPTLPHRSRKRQRCRIEPARRCAVSLVPRDSDDRPHEL
jgi:hypothetical protein